MRFGFSFTILLFVDLPQQSTTKFGLFHVKYIEYNTVLMVRGQSPIFERISLIGQTIEVEMFH